MNCLELLLGNYGRIIVFSLEIVFLEKVEGKIVFFLEIYF